MPPTPLTPTVRYIPPGTRKVYWVTTIATYTAPTRAELNAGIDLSAEVAAVTGFTVTSATTPTPDLSSRFTSEIPAAITAASCSLSIYATSTSSDVRTVLPRGTIGFVVMLWEGDVTGQRMDVFPATVTTSAVNGNMTAAELVDVSFSITKVPANNVLIP
jgi:hypothetical protein